jgi:hypothetical protein
LQQALSCQSNEALSTKKAVCQDGLFVSAMRWLPQPISPFMRRFSGHIPEDFLLGLDPVLLKTSIATTALFI